VPTVGILGVGIMNSTAFFLLANNNSKLDGNQISFETIDFQPHPPAFTLIFASLDEGTDLTIGSLSFRVGSLGSICLSDPMKSDPSAGKTATIAISESSVGSSSEVNSPVSFTTVENTEDRIEELDETMGNLTWESNQETSLSAATTSQTIPPIHGKQDWIFMRMSKPPSQASTANMTISTKYSRS
jgi:hypothetical protein